MDNLQELIKEYLEFCSAQKCLDFKTLKAYRIDLRQFSEWVHTKEVSPAILEGYIAMLHKQYRPGTAKHKIASLKAFFHFLECRGRIGVNPFNRIQVHFREPSKLPKTIPLYIVEKLLASMYAYRKNAKTTFQRTASLRDIAVVELLFASGMRISELCSLQKENVNLHDGTILIYGKGGKERFIQLGDGPAANILKEYQAAYGIVSGYFFVSRDGKPMSDQAARRMIRRYTALAGIDIRITPHMFRHTFATSLLEAGVDIRYIQEMLGHSSIKITEIYTHVAVSKQRDILLSKHPRKDLRI